MAKELVKVDAPPKAQIARSLDTAQKGELVYLNARGQVVSKTGMRVRQVFLWTWVVACWTYAGSMVGVTSGALAGVGVVLVGVAFTARYLIYTPAIRHGNALVANHRWDEALAAFDALEKRRMPRALKRSVSAAIGELLAATGRHEEGLVRIDAELARQRRAWTRIAKLKRWRLQMVRASVLARLGRIEEARRQRDEAQAKAKPATLASEYGQMLTHSVALDIAFHADAPADLPDDTVLHGWARGALARTAFGVIVVELAWAFHRRGDDDMARHLLAESTSRMSARGEELRRGYPRLAAWADAQRVAWGIPEGETDEAV